MPASGDNERALCDNLRAEARETADAMERLIEMLLSPAETQDQL